RLGGQLRGRAVLRQRRRALLVGRGARARGLPPRVLGLLPERLVEALRQLGRDGVARVQRQHALERGGRGLRVPARDGRARLGHGGVEVLLGFFGLLEQRLCVGVVLVVAERLARARRGGRVIVVLEVGPRQLQLARDDVERDHAVLVLHARGRHRRFA